MQWRAEVPEDMAALSAALGLGRDEAGEFDESYYEDEEAEGYEAFLDDEDEADEDDEADDHEHGGDDGNDEDDRA
jgi:23S rRNA pseudouridine1911/1915/1917 synthase